MMYIAKLTNRKESLIKVGYTKFYTTDKRYYDFYKSFDKVDTLQIFNSDQVDYQKLEKDLNKFTLNKYKVQPLTRFNGHTECYNEYDLTAIIELIQKYSNLYTYRKDRENLTPLPNRISLCPYNKVKLENLKFCNRYRREVFYFKGCKFIPLLFSGLAIAVNESDGKVYNLRMRKLPLECKPHPVTGNYKTETGNKVFLEFSESQVMEDLSK